MNFTKEHFKKHFGPDTPPHAFDTTPEGLARYIEVWNPVRGAIIVVNRDYSISVNGKRYVGKKYEMVLSILKIFFERTDGNYGLILGAGMPDSMNGIKENGYFNIETPKTKIKLIQHPEQHHYDYTITKEQKDKREQAIRRYQTTLPERYKITFPAGLEASGRVRRASKSNLTL